VDKFVSGRTHLLDTCTGEPAKDMMKGVKEEVAGAGRKESTQNMKVVELTMLRWSGRHSRPFLFGILTDGTILCYHAYLFEGPDGTSKLEDSVSAQSSVGASSISASRLRNLRFVRVPLDTYTREETSSETSCQRITTFKNISGYQGFFLSGSRPAWFMVFRERLRVHPQVSSRQFELLSNDSNLMSLDIFTAQGSMVLDKCLFFFHFISLSCCYI
jgi:cleavage and polyadenylation specificity factor subunit 1